MNLLSKYLHNIHFKHQEGIGGEVPKNRCSIPPLNGNRVCLYDFCERVFSWVVFTMWQLKSDKKDMERRPVGSNTTGVKE